jgi:hypothetical protein
MKLKNDRNEREDSNLTKWESGTGRNCGICLGTDGQGKSCYMFGIQKRHFYGNAEDRCLGSNNSSVVILTAVSTVITKGSLSSNGRRYMRLH